jgi:hypothetical protein
LCCDVRFNSLGHGRRCATLHRMSEFQETVMHAREVRDDRMVAAKRNAAGGTAGVPERRHLAKATRLPNKPPFACNTLDAAGLRAKRGSTANHMFLGRRE